MPCPRKCRLTKGTIITRCRLPSVLFELTNLTVLSLREPIPVVPSTHKLRRFVGGNRLTALPAAIGELHNLKELNISNNQIVRYQDQISRC